jgi:hypothetical protein
MNSVKFHSQRFISGPEKGSTRVIYPPHFGLKKLRRAEGGTIFVGVFRVIYIFYAKTKIIFFPILGGAPSPPGSAPDISKWRLAKCSLCNDKTATIL